MTGLLHNIVEFAASVQTMPQLRTELGSTMPSSEAAVRPRVLIAEDDDSLRRLLELRLTSDGFEPRTACDGVQAL